MLRIRVGVGVGVGEDLGDEEGDGDIDSGGTFRWGIAFHRNFLPLLTPARSLPPTLTVCPAIRHGPLTLSAA